MQHNRIEEVSDKIMSTIEPPAGWAVVEQAETVTEDDITDEQGLKSIVNNNLSFVTSRVEHFVDMAYKDFNILILESYIFIDADAAFHIVLLVSQEDYISPHMVALKIQAKEQLTTDQDVSMRFKFTNSEEYTKFHDTERTYKLKYVYKQSGIRSNGAIEFSNDRHIPHFTPHYKHHSDPLVKKEKGL